MDGRPRRTASNVDYNELERAYDQQIKAELQEASRRRSSTSERDVRKRKRESDSPTQILRHTAIREGLRNSAPLPTTEVLSAGDSMSPELTMRHGRHDGYVDAKDAAFKAAADHDSDIDGDSDHAKRPRIVKLQLARLKSLSHADNDSMDTYAHGNGNAQPDTLYDQRPVRRSARVSYNHDEDEADEELVPNHAKSTRAPKVVADYKDESEAESEEQYIPRKSSRRARPIDSDESQTEAAQTSQPKSPRQRRSGRQPLRRARPQSDDDDEEDYIEGSADDDDQISEISLLSDPDDLNNFVEDDEGHSRAKRTKASKRQNRHTKRTRRPTRIAASEDDFSGQSSSVDLQAELEDLRPIREETRRRELRDRTNRPDYALPPPLTDQMIVAAATPTRNRSMHVRTSFRGLYPEYSDLGLGLTSNNHKFGNFGPPAGLQSDTDSSDEEGQTSKTAAKTVAGALLPAMKSLDQSGGGGPSNHGKIKGSNLADADPIGIDKNVNFESVGGLEDHINQLKEMVSLPLLYPEIFQRFHIAPPRGVLFHGPPGTGKTLMARALAASCSSEGRKISFYMRKGADCLSKWVGEAERQLRLLFDEAKANQPSIIFFDEIDGLAPVRSAKQDQIHASIVSTMLALMDGMDARGQVVVIGATNRPDSVDPALRRPGRFDREFYFPLPALAARKQIITIQTSQWNPPLSEDFRAQLALQTKGYGGADLRALCTEAALNAVQRRYPQIYTSNDKLVIDPATIKVIPRDFMLAIKKIIPSSARSNVSGAAMLPQHMRPLLADKLQQITDVLDRTVPTKNRKTALEDNATAPDDDNTFAKENMLQVLEQMRTYRPRLLLTGSPGMGQQHLGRAILHHLEGFHVQNIDLSMMFSDSASTAEASIIQAFVEARRHKPSVLYMPEVELWFATASATAISTLNSLLATIGANDPLLLLGISSTEAANLAPEILNIFGHGSGSNINLRLSTDVERREFFTFLVSVICKSPAELPDAMPRVARQLEVLPIAPPAPPREITKAEKKAIEIKDKKTKLMLKAKLGPLMEVIKTRYKRFKKPIIDDREIAHLLIVDQDAIPDDVGNRDYEKTDDGKILKRSTGKLFYNTDINLIEERLWSNLYLTPRQFQADIEQILHDASQEEADRERILKAQEMHTNVLIHLEEMFDTTFIDECKAMAHREVNRHQAYLNKLAQLESKAIPKQLENGNAAAISRDETADLQAEHTAEPNSVSQFPDSPVPTEIDLQPHRGTITNSTVHDDELMPDASQPSNDSGFTTTAGPSLTNGTDEDLHNTNALSPGVVLNPPTKSPPVTLQSILNPQSNTIHATIPSPHLESPAVPSFVAPATEDELASPTSKEIEHDPYELDHDQLETMQRRWVILTNGLTIDQLEMINSAAIDAIWAVRSLWNRNPVASAADAAIKDVCRMLRPQS